MKNLLFLVWSTLGFGLLGQNFVESHARNAFVSSKMVAECMDRTNITMVELIRLRESPEERIKLINGDGDFRRYGCFLACTAQLRGVMIGATFNASTIENIDRSVSSDLDMNSFLHKTIQMCSNSLNETDDECDIALTFKVCIMKAFRNRL